MSVAPHKRLRRPDEDASAPEVNIYRRTLGAALVELGVEHGDEFIVIAARDFQQQSSLDDLDGLGPFAKDSETSRAAALDTYPRSNTHRWKILHATARRDGATRDELEGLTGLSGNTIRPRVQELIAGGFLYESSGIRPTKNGSDAVVLGITDKARDEIRREYADRVVDGT